MKTEEALIYLVSCAVNRITPDSGLVRSFDREALFSLAFEHQLTVLCASALRDAGEKDPRFNQEWINELWLNRNFRMQRLELLKRLEDAGIWYMPMKGVILQDCYPQAGMRQMCDNDILFDPFRAEDVREIMESIGFKPQKTDFHHHENFIKPPAYKFEMHYTLFAADFPYKKVLNYYSNIKDRMIRDEGSNYGYHLSLEDFYIYMIAHEYKHYMWGGTGLRSLLDVYVYLQHHAGRLDMVYITGEMKKLGIAEFEEKNRGLAFRVFSPEAAAEENGWAFERLSPKEQEMLSYFIRSGAYGIYEHTISNGVESLGMFRYILQRIFIPLRLVKKCYPFFYRHKVLLPFLPVYRLVKRREGARNEIKVLRKLH